MSSEFSGDVSCIYKKLSETGNPVRVFLPDATSRESFRVMLYRYKKTYESQLVDMGIIEEKDIKSLSLTKDSDSEGYYILRLYKKEKSLFTFTDLNSSVLPGAMT